MKTKNNDQDLILEKINKIDKELLKLEKFRLRSLEKIELDLQKQIRKIEKEYRKQLILIEEKYKT